MLAQVIDRPPAAGNVPPVDHTEAQRNPPHPVDRTEDRTAGEILAESSWAVPISRPMVMAFNNPRDFPALLAWAAVRAWTDRRVHSNPPGGWPRMAGMSDRTWYTARRRAVALGLISASRGSSRIVPLAKLEPHQQFAKAPTEILFDRSLSRTARRVFIALSLYRSGFGDSRVAVRTLADGSDTNRRDVRRALRELENQWHITSMGATGRGAVRYCLKGQAISYPQKGTAPEGQSGNETPPHRGQSGNETPPNPATTPPLSVGSNLDSLKRRAALALADGTAPRDEQPTKTEAKAINCRFGLKAVGADFGKPASGLQGQQAKRVAEPLKPKWRTLNDDTARQLFKNWTAQDFEAAIQSAQASLPDANPGEFKTLKAQILDFSDQLQRMPA